MASKSETVWSSWPHEPSEQAKLMKKARAEQKRNKCRDLVHVPDKLAERLEILQRKYPDACWRYPPAELLIPFYTQQLKLGRNSSCSSAMETFYALVNFHCSPWEFYLQPKAFEPLRDRLSNQMAEVYGDDTIQSFEPDDGILQDPGLHPECSVAWCRAVILRLPANMASDDSTVFVRFVDWGHTGMVWSAECKPLLARFSRCPPLAIHCRMSNIDINDLTSDRVEDFMQTMSDVAYQARVQLLKFGDPLIVKLWHPTVLGVDLGKSFYLNGPRYPLRNAVARHGEIYLERDLDWSNGSGSSSSTKSSSRGNVDLKLDVIALDRVSKPPRNFDMDVVVTHVQNHKMIYVQTVDQFAHFCAMQHSIGEAFVAGNLPEINVDLVDEGLTVCARWPSVVGGQMGPWLRAVVLSITPSALHVQSVDTGHLSPPIHFNRLSDSVRALPRAFRVPPLVFVGRLDSCTFQIHESVTHELRCILAPATVDHFSITRQDLAAIKSEKFGILTARFFSSAAPPTKMALKLHNSGVSTIVQSRVAARDTQCRSLVAQKYSPVQSLLERYMSIGKWYSYESRLCAAMIKGNLKLGLVRAAGQNCASFDGRRYDETLDWVEREMGAIVQ